MEELLFPSFKTVPFVWTLVYGTCTVVDCRVYEKKVEKEVSNALIHFLSAFIHPVYVHYIID